MVNLPSRDGPAGSVSITKITIDFSPAEGLTGADIEVNGGVVVIEDVPVAGSSIAISSNTKIPA